MWDESWIEKLRDVIRRFTVLAQTGELPPEAEQAELVLDPDALETNVYLGGDLAELLGRDGSYQVSHTGTGVSLFHKAVVQLFGAHTVGDWNPDPAADKSYDDNRNYPAIQRGQWSGGELWWDPYYIPAADPGDPDCEPGWIYLPRNSNPTALIPDLQDYFERELPAVVADLRPLDQHGGWAYVQVPLNFTTAASSLTTLPATASVYDPETGETLWAEATATPTRLIFQPGDGTDPLICYMHEATRRFDPEAPGNCAHTYLHSSNTEPGKAFKAVLGVEWQGLYNDSDGNTLTFPIAGTSVEMDLAVGEARASVALEP